MTEPRVSGMTENPAAAIERAFRAIYRERMREMPFVNTSLEVEAIGFREWDRHWLGVLVTPWFMNLMLVPREAGAWPRRPIGEPQAYAFPAGVCEFLEAREAMLGEYALCSLFSPMFEFADHTAARAMAKAVLSALFEPAHRDASEPQANADRTRPLAVLEDGAPLSKRDFLHGAWLVPGARRPA